MQTSALYSDGPEPVRVADLYGIELADTAAYVFKQHLRYGSGIYSDAIHMRGAEPAGPSIAQPSCGHEVYARAVRSVIPFTSQIIDTPISNFTFDDSTQGFTSYSAASVTAVDGQLKVVKTTSNTSQWGGWGTIPPVKKGDVLRIRGNWSFEDGYSGNNISIGTQGGGSGWGSTVRSSAPGTFDVTVTVSRDILSGGRLLFFGNNDTAPLNAAFSIDDIVITLNPTTVAIDMIPDRTEEGPSLPPARVVTDLKTPADAIVILPKDEAYLASDHTARGSLGAHPRGSGSFARRFFAGTGATEDLLTLTTGQKAVIPSTSAVGFSIIRYAGSADATVTLEVRRNATLLKTINLSAGYNREGYEAILTPTQYGQLPPVETGDIELTVTAGTLKICAFVVLTTDIDLITPQTLAFPAIADRSFGQDDNHLVLAATSSAGSVPITFSVISGPATITGNTLTITGTGSVTVEASQAGDATYSAASATQTFIVTKADQVITFAGIPDKTISGSTTFPVSALASSGLPVSFSISSEPADIATLSGDTLVLSGAAGSVTVTAQQMGDANYSAAPNVVRTFGVARGTPTQTQKITFAQPATATYGDEPLTLSATASSGLPINFQLISGPATLDDTTLTTTGAGKVVIRAVQPGAYPYKSATAVTRTITVKKKTLLVNSPDFTRLVTHANPADYGLTYTGFVGADTAADLDKRPVASTKANAKSPAGVYPITITGGSDNNYVFAPGDLGSLTVLGFGGAYETLLADADGIPLGKLELTVSANAFTYTGTLNLASEPGSVTVVSNTKIPLSLLVPIPDGSAASATWTRAANSAKSISALSLRIDLAGDTLNATLTRGGLADLSGTGSRVFTQPVVSGKKQNAPWTGAHTLVLRDPQPLNESDTRPLPLGAGHASATVTATGVMSLKGKLADGVTLTATAKPDSTGRYRVFIKPYGTRLDSFVSGPLALQPHPDQTRFKNRHFVAETDGLLFWAKAPLPSSTKPAAQDKTYRQGFAADVSAALDPWIAPAAKSATVNGGTIPAGTLVQRLGLGDSPASAASVAVAFTLPEGIDFGARDAFLPTSLALSAKGAFTVPAPLPAKAGNPAFTLNVTPATGAFSGSFVLLDQVPAPIAAKPSATKPITRKATISGTLRQGPDGEATLGHAHVLFDPVPGDTGPASTEQISAELILTAP